MSSLDMLWLILCAALVFLMQAGFLCLESGLTRSKNSINVAIKNLADFCLTTIVFWVIGFSLMFGDTVSGWYGTGLVLPDFSTESADTAVFFLFQVMFCGAAVTIISGVVAERLKFGAYLIVALFISGLVYPVAGHWSWASFGGGSGDGFLASMGFVDFAGSSVVHSVGGWSGLALLMVIGPRIGRFGEFGPIKASNLPLATLGVLLLFIGWLGFNGGSTLVMDESVPLILVNTIIGGSVGALAAGGLGYAVHNNLNVTQFMNGALGGLVAITANCFAVSTPIAALIGLVGGMVVVFAEDLLEKFHLDDAVGAIPVHLAAGIWGTLATGLYGDLEVLGTGLSRGEQISVQALGVLTYAAWSFGISYALFWIINRVFRLRVSAEHEIAGLNISEHAVENEDAAQHLASDIQIAGEKVS
ncbi:ammonium transporter [uncultured Boseongicola sp.]|jgi:Amt family ammonium transporter|uniref:ammonium transporter n=1 Tax=uncultured Boseongicola sp. TaxID=1648499 RepID=UPI00262BE1CD|nr:ammonium transporter [uncultured Boseongicola sp.]